MASSVLVSTWRVRLQKAVKYIPLLFSSRTCPGSLGYEIISLTKLYYYLARGLSREVPPTLPSFLPDQGYDLIGADQGFTIAFPSSIFTCIPLYSITFKISDKFSCRGTVPLIVPFGTSASYATATLYQRPICRMMVPISA